MEWDRLDPQTVPILNAVAITRVGTHCCMDDENENQLDTNPYASNNPKAVSADLAYKAGSFWSVPLLGALWSVVSAFPIAGMIALLFRFPVPLSGYMSGASAVIPAMIGVAVYGILLGGFVLVAALGALGATLATKLLPQHSKRWTIGIVSVAITTGFLLVLSVLDWLIGSW